MPGPGNYQNKDCFGDGKGFSIGAKKDPKYNENPGPGSYNNHEASSRVKTASSAYKIGNSKR